MNVVPDPQLEGSPLRCGDVVVEATRACKDIMDTRSGRSQTNLHVAHRLKREMCLMCLTERSHCVAFRFVAGLEVFG